VANHNCRVNSDYARRSRTLPWLEDEDFPEESEDKDAGLQHLPNSNYFGAIFLTQADAPSLRILVNREGFVPDMSFNHLVKLVRTGIDLATRVRASVSSGQRNQRREQRTQHRSETGTTATRSTSTERAVGVSISRATSFANEARQLVLDGDLAGATEKISNAVAELEETVRVREGLISESSMLRVLASVGTQMAAFIHEINALLGMTQAIDNALSRLRDDPSLTKLMRTDIAKVHSGIGDLRRHLERQASYLIDVVTPDARRRRSRQSLAERFDAARRLVEYQAARRSIVIHNELPPDMKSPPMFPAELTTIFSNLLTNAVKAAGDHGEVRAFANPLEGGRIRIVIENTGVAVDPESGERWFKPFESTTITVDPVLGQGMGLGLPITRSMLEEYGAEIRFTQPSEGYATAVEIIFPK
jgi:signal transduction histidine kinase